LARRIRGHLANVGARARLVWAAIVAVLGVAGAIVAGQSSTAGTTFAIAAGPAVFEGPVGRADCGPGSLPEPGVQGQVPKADRDSGRSRRGYHCNLDLVGRYQGEGSSWVSPSYGSCAYMSTRFPSNAKSQGVQVVDVSDPANPKLATTLNGPAMRGTWESLKVNERRGLLAGVSAPDGSGVAFFEVYDIKQDCKNPRLLNSLPLQAGAVPASGGGHEGDWSPDGRTYWATMALTGTITAIDVEEPSRPRVLFMGSTGQPLNHGFGVSPDGNRLYLAQIGGAPANPGNEGGNGLRVFDVSDIQARRPAPQIRQIGTLFWTDGAGGQHTLPISYGGRSHLVFVDEAGEGAARIIDIADESKPQVISKLKLSIHFPAHAQRRDADLSGQKGFGYQGHYCQVDRPSDPTALACGYFQSGIRVFDIRDPRRPREVAYFNPPAQTGRAAELQSSEHPKHDPEFMTADWCSSPPRFVGDQLWVTCQDNGFMALRFTNGVWPIRDQPARRCVSRRAFDIRLPKGTRLRGARVLVGSKRAKVRRRRGRVVARIDLRGLSGTVRVRITGRTARGRKVRSTRRFRTCG
jgi:hypothetical protein